MKKIIGIIMGLFGVVLSVVGIIWKVKGKMSVSIIGGADGPTSVFIAGKVGGEYSAYAIIIGAIFLVIAGVIFFKHKH